MFNLTCQLPGTKGMIVLCSGEEIWRQIHRIKRLLNYTASDCTVINTVNSALRGLSIVFNSSLLTAAYPAALCNGCLNVPFPFCRSFALIIVKALRAQRFSSLNTKQEVRNTFTLTYIRPNIEVYSHRSRVHTFCI